MCVVLPLINIVRWITLLWIHVSCFALNADKNLGQILFWGTQMGCWTICADSRRISACINDDNCTSHACLCLFRGHGRCGNEGGIWMGYDLPYDPQSFLNNFSRLKWHKITWDISFYKYLLWIFSLILLLELLWVTNAI